MMKPFLMRRGLRNRLLAAVAVLPLAGLAAVHARADEPLVFMPDAAHAERVDATILRLNAFSPPAFREMVEARGRDLTKWTPEPLAETREQALELTDILPPAPFKRDEPEELFTLSEAPLVVAREAKGWHQEAGLATALRPAAHAPLPQLWQAVGQGLAVVVAYTPGDIPLPRRKPAMGQRRAAAAAMPLPRRKNLRLAARAASAPARVRKVAAKTPAPRQPEAWQSGPFATTLSQPWDCLPWSGQCFDPTPLK